MLAARPPALLARSSLTHTVADAAPLHLCVRCSSLCRQLLSAWPIGRQAHTHALHFARISHACALAHSPTARPSRPSRPLTRLHTHTRAHPLGSPLCPPRVSPRVSARASAAPPRHALCCPALGPTPPHTIDYGLDAALADGPRCSRWSESDRAPKLQYSSVNESQHKEEEVSLSGPAT